MPGLHPALIYLFSPQGKRYKVIMSTAHREIFNFLKVQNTAMSQSEHQCEERTTDLVPYLYHLTYRMVLVYQSFSINFNDDLIGKNGSATFHPVHFYRSS